MSIREISKSITARRNKIIIHLLAVRHKTVKEVAAKYGLSVFSVYSIIRRAN
jgi:DNA-binding CsgD family transcriptional regulator